MPRFSLEAAVSLALPLFIVTMASQNLPGVTAMRAAEAHEDPTRRTVSAVTCGAAVTGVMAAFPHELAVAIAGVGAAFWAVVAGTIALVVQQWRKT